MPELDEVDKAILRRLQKDARVSFNEIAKEVGTSEATVFVRIKKLQKNGVIRAFRAIVDPESVGKQVTAFALVRAEPKSYAKVLAELQNLDDVCEVYDVTGAYYSIIKMRTSTSEQLAKVLDKIGEIDGIVGTETVIALRTIKEETEIKF
ncbi:Lrp/AsnC family transcriptional regulator [Candidatus Bathyarchaeota archaeon]|nr:Lrp/AsnC family transcriptional regulator [Candidatus Bathyarchaeota archaeon]